MKNVDEIITKRIAGLCPPRGRKRNLVLWFLLLGAIASVPAAAQISLEDATGTTVTLDSPARRVISLAPHITETVYAAGAGSTLVGTVSYSDYPAAAKDLEQVGSYDIVSYESIAVLKPDLVLAWRSGNGAESIQKLRALGFTVFAEEPRALEDVATSLRNIGVLTGSETSAEEAAREFLDRLAGQRERFSNHPPLGVYYQIWDEPLLTLNGEHPISDVIRLCSGRNVFAESVALVSRISVESVIRADPQVIIASGMDKARPEWLDKWHRWTSISAVEHGQLYFVPPDLLQRHTPRILDGSQLLCEHLEKARRFYSGLGS